MAMNNPTFVPVGLVEGLLTTLGTAMTSHLVGALGGLVLLLPLASVRPGRHLLQAIGFAILATPILIASLLITNALGAGGAVPAAMGMLPSFAITLVIGADAATSAERSVPAGLARHESRPLQLLQTLYAPFLLVGTLTALLLSFPATLLYTTIGDMVSGASDPSLGRLILGTLPSGRIDHLTVLAICLCVAGGFIWWLYGVGRLIAISSLRMGELDIEDRWHSTPESALQSSLVPLTAIAVVLLSLAVGSRILGDHLLIRSPEVSLAALGSDYVTFSELIGLTIDMLGKAVLAALLAALAGYTLTAVLPSVLVPLRLALLGSAFVVQIVPIVMLAAILWLTLPDLPNRDLLVATLSSVYPAFQIFRERQSTIPVGLLDLMTTRSVGALRGQWFVRMPWSMSAVPTVVLATVPVAVNALIASDYALRSDGLGRWLHAINARGEVTMVQGIFVVILVCSLVSASILIGVKRVVDRTMSKQKAGDAGAHHS